MIHDKQREIIHLQNALKINELDYLTKREDCNFNGYSIPIAFLIDKYEGKLSQEDADLERIRLI